ncbi:MAG: hypothetical protein ACKVHO_10150 [Verrucomicrobiia bacterium]
MQFQRRDSAAAQEDLSVLLGRAMRQLAGAPIDGGLLCCCNGQGQ